MSEPDVSIRKTQEFIEDAQEIIARTRDLMAALNKLAGKTGDHDEADPKKLAQQARLEEELESLVQRYFTPLAAPSDGTGQSNNSRTPAPGGSAAIPPGRFRPRI